MRVLVACEYSGAVRDAFIARGHDAMSCDILPTESPGPHYQGDARDCLTDEWDLLIAHPPCTYLSNTGSQWLHKDPDRWGKMRDAAAFFQSFIHAPIESVAIENPIMHKYAVDIIGQRQSQVIQPWMFGHLEQKATCFWLKNLPRLQPTLDVRSKMMELPYRERHRLHYLPPSEDRAKLRSRTFDGVAEAMAAQWGDGEGDLFGGM